MTIKELLAKYINKRKSLSLDIELLLARILNKNRQYLFTYPEKKITLAQLRKFQSLVKRRVYGEPLAYILGEKEFYGNKFLVNKNVLIPRPETELMVDEAVGIIENYRGALGAAAASKALRLIDIGTGSGCIIISIAKSIKSKLNSIYAVDISKKALNVARKNAWINNINNIKFIQGDLLAPIKNKIKATVIITANLPYLTPGQAKSSPSLKFEPKLALLGGVNGLKYYKKLFKQIKNRDNEKIHLLCEIDPSQKAKVIALIKKELPQYECQIKKDLKGHNRLAIIEKQ